MMFSLVCGYSRSRCREKVYVKPLLDVGQEYTIRLRKLDNTAKFCVSIPQIVPHVVEELSKRLLAIYSRMTVPVVEKPEKGDHIVFQVNSSK